MKKAKIFVAIIIVNILAVSYFVGYCYSRANLHLVHRCVPVEVRLPGDEYYLASAGHHYIGVPLHGLGVNSPKSFEYYFYSPLRWLEGFYWKSHYKNGQQLLHFEARPYS